jgi:3-hydroxyisobutyrate dehydrogenase-like beta-hydroxyacid dehydrogenase
MIVGFIGFGEVALRLSTILMENGCEIISSSKRRSPKTKKLMESLNVKDLKDLKEVAKSCDILISANSPSKAVHIGEKYGSISNNLFLDLNNISPISTSVIARSIGKNFVDGAIIGNITSNKHAIFLSGENAEKIAILNDVRLNIKVISNKIGDASKIKMLRSIYTKGVSALLIEIFKIAKELNLESELFNTLVITEGDDFETSSKSRIKNSLKSSKRKHEEIEEIINFLNDFDDVNMDLIKSVKNSFKSFKKDLY